MAAPAIRFALDATVTRADIPALCAELADRLGGRPGEAVTCDVSAVTRPDVVTVEALARLRLTARGHGRRLVVSGSGPHLRQLLGLLGLANVLPEVGGQAEHREQAAGVEEVVDGRDPSA